jgi:hypothetical protein
LLCEGRLGKVNFIHSDVHFFEVDIFDFDIFDFFDLEVDIFDLDISIITLVLGKIVGLQDATFFHLEPRAKRKGQKRPRIGLETTDVAASEAGVQEQVRRRDCLGKK